MSEPAARDRVGPLAPFVAPLLTTLALLLVFPLWIDGTVSTTGINQLGRYLCLALVALSLDLLWGYAGILSLCQMMFFTLGGYAFGMYLCMHGPLDGEVPRALAVVSSTVGGDPLPWFWKPFGSAWAGILGCTVLPGAVAFAFGWFAFRSRVRGVYFSIITQACTLAAQLVFGRNETKLCGTNGLTNFTEILGFPLDDSAKGGLYLISVLALGGAWCACLMLVRSRSGRVLVAVRDNESRLRFAGYPPHAYKAFAFTIAAAIAGLGGALYTAQNGIITPAKMAPSESILIVAMVALGGRGTLSGAVLGCLALCYVQSELTSGGRFLASIGLGGLVTKPAEWLDVKPAELWLLVLGLLFVGVTLFAPAGLLGAGRSLSARVAGLLPGLRPPPDADDAEEAP